MTEEDGRELTQSAPFARMELRGERFDGGKLPVTSLVELERFRALVLAAAQERWLAEHEGQELPEDFNQELHLDIVQLSTGSAISEMEIAESPYSGYYSEAREDVERAFESIVKSEFSDANGAWLDRPEFWNFGDTLEGSETLVIRKDSQASERAWIVGFTRSSRFERAYAALHPPVESGPVERLRRRTEDGQVAGRLIEVNAEKKTFVIRSLRFGDIAGKYVDEELTDDLRDVLNSSARAPVVRVIGTFSYVEDDLKRVSVASAVELLEIDGEPWSRRFIELAQLDRGWLDGDSGGEPVVFAAMEAARELLRRIRDAGRREPGIFPMEDGGILLEWADQNELMSLEISPELSLHMFHVGRRQGVVESESTSSLDAAGAFVERIAPS